MQKNWLRSAATQELLEETDQALSALDPAAAEAFLQELVATAAAPTSAAAAISAAMGPTFLADLELVPWVRARAQTHGGAVMAAQRLAAPLADHAALRDRQRTALQASASSSVAADLAALRANEANVLWWFAGAGADLRATFPMFGLLFPQMFGLRWANRVPPLVTSFQLYRCYIVPWMALLAPLSTIFGPYMYIRRTLQWRVPIRQYLKFIKVGIVAFLRPAVLPEHTALKYVVLAGYIGLLIYGILQAFDLAATLSRVRKQLAEKADSVRAIFGCAAGAAAADLLPSGLAGAYALATDPHIRALVADRLRELYAQDVAVLTGDLARQPRWCIPDYRTGGQMWDLRHPVLASNHADTESTAKPAAVPAIVGNPADLSRSLIVTGPNAAGKTTYTKALAANLLLAQTLGVVCARRADLAPVDAFGAFVRVSDTIGEASLYQAEVQRCADLCTQATALSAAGRRAVYILDEPMRSTPPTEGAATAAAVVGYLTRLPGIRVIMTSHFAVLTELATAMPDRVHNIHMAAEPAAKGGFTFSYRLRRGPSFQCIALELLAAGGSTAATLPKEVIQSAIEIKNKICRGIVSNGDQPIANGTSA